MTEEPIDGELDIKRGMEAALRVAASLVYEEPDELVIRDFVKSSLFAEPPFETSDAALLEGLAMLDAWCESAGTGDLSEEVGALRREHLRLFVGCGEPLVPSWATYHSDPNSQLFGRETLEVRAAYREFDLRLERVGSEPDDHLGLMMRFLAHLLALECDAIEHGAVVEASRLHEAQGRFLAAHVLPWLPVWVYAGRKSAASGYFRGCVELVFGLLREYAALFGISYRGDPPSFVRHLGADLSGAMPTVS